MISSTTWFSAWIQLEWAWSTSSTSSASQGFPAALSRWGLGCLWCLWKIIKNRPNLDFLNLRRLIPGCSFAVMALEPILPWDLPLRFCYFHHHPHHHHHHHHYPQHPSRVHGVFLVNPSAGRSSAKDNWNTVKNMVVVILIGIIID